MRNFSDSLPDGWLAFELGVLRRLQFRSVAEPFAGESAAPAYLKRWGVRVAANDAARWAWTRATARVENNAETLTEEDVQVVLEDAYVPRHRLYNPALRRWFGETDAWWFDNVRANTEKLSPTKRELALDVGMAVGDYALAFDEETRELRQPLSRAFVRLRDALPAPFDNRQRNTASNKDARDFVSREQGAELLLLRLPRPTRRAARDSAWAWREEWVRGGGDFWDDFERSREGRLGARAEARRQYLRHVEDLLDAASHIPTWAVAYADDGFLPTEELVESVGRLRRVGTVYTKDFTELTGARAVIVTA